MEEQRWLLLAPLAQGGPDLTCPCLLEQDRVRPEVDFKDTDWEAGAPGGKNSDRLPRRFFEGENGAFDH